LPFCFAKGSDAEETAACESRYRFQFEHKPIPNRGVTFAADSQRYKELSMFSRISRQRLRPAILLMFTACLGAGTLNGCRKERVVDVQTPVGDVNVDRDKLDGDVDVKVDVD
jgi:hypothetical protein